MIGTHFYFNSIRNACVVFGALFSDIILRIPATTDAPEKFQKVPIVFANKQQYIYFLEDKIKGNTVNFYRALPRMSYELKTINPDTTRKANAMSYNTLNQTTGTAKKQMAPLAVTLGFTLAIYVKNMEDSLQIIEQILPFFAPELSVKANELQELGIVNDIKVVFNSVNMVQDNAQDGFGSNRFIVWEMDFDLHCNVFPPVSQSAIINTATVDVENEFQKKLQRIIMEGKDPDYMDQTKVDKTIIDEPAT